MSRKCITDMPKVISRSLRKMYLGCPSDMWYIRTVAPYVKRDSLIMSNKGLVAKYNISYSAVFEIKGGGFIV